MKKILIINSDPDTMELLQGLLQLEGYKIKLNSAIQEVPAILKSFNPHLILLDITRKDVIEKVNDEAKKNGMPVLLMTGHDNYPHNPDDSIKDIIKKPFTMDELLKKIDRVLNMVSS